MSGIFIAVGRFREWFLGNMTIKGNNKLKCHAMIGIEGCFWGFIHTRYTCVLQQNAGQLN